MADQGVGHYPTCCYSRQSGIGYTLITMGTVKIHNAVDEFTALSLRDMLLQAGIPAMIRTNQVAGYNLNITWGEVVGYGDILVNEEDEERARELIGGFLGKLGELGELSEEEMDSLALSAEPSEDELVERDEI
jgi:hypothetical protein